LDPQVRSSRQNPFCERQDALYVEFFDRLGLVVDLRERQFLAQLVALTFVARQVDRLRVEERFVQPIQLLLNRFDAPLDLGGVILHLGRDLLPYKEHAILHEPHIAGGRLQQRELVDEQPFQLRFAHVDRPALPLAVVVRVVPVPALRPAPRQRPAARLAPDEISEREIRMIPLARSGDLNALIGHGLRAVKRLLAHERLEVPARGNAVIGTLD
jgi:hypothetical protein